MQLITTNVASRHTFTHDWMRMHRDWINTKLWILIIKSDFLFRPIILYYLFISFEKNQDAVIIIIKAKKKSESRKEIFAICHCITIQCWENLSIQIIMENWRCAIRTRVHSTLMHGLVFPWKFDKKVEPTQIFPEGGVLWPSTSASIIYEYIPRHGRLGKKIHLFVSDFFSSKNINML